MRHFIKITCISILLGLSMPVFSQNTGQQQTGGHRKPPREAIEACDQVSSGSQCSFTDPKGNNVSGTCFAPQDDLPLACKPEGGGPPPPDGENGERSPPPD